METLGMTPVGLLVTLLSVLLMVQLDRIVPHGDEPDKTAGAVQTGVFYVVVWCVIIAWTILMHNDQASTFIYFQF